MFVFKKGTTSHVWEFKDPDTGRVHSANTRQELFTLIKQYREQNNLPPIYRLSTVVENYLCSLPVNLGACVPAKLNRSIYQYVKGGVSLLVNMLYSSTVSQEQADARASICLTCPHNVFPDKGGFLNWSDEIAEASIGSRKSIHHDKLGNCDVCTCVLKAKVWYGGPIDLPSDQKELIKKTKPDCWQLIDE